MHNNNEDEYDLENPFGLETDSDFHRTRKNTTIRLIQEFAKSKTSLRLLDVGCGNGSITKLIENNISNVKIDAIDISHKAIQMALKDNQSIQFSQADAMTFTGFGYFYDCIVLNNIYEHVENPVGLLKNLKKILNSDGIFIISTPNRYFIRNIFRKLLGLKILIPRYHITEYSIGQLYDHHRYAGLSIKKNVLPEFKRERRRVIDFILYRFFQPVVDFYLKLMKSKTRTGSLLFIISSKID